jgi:hypothetical protein
VFLVQYYIGVNSTGYAADRLMFVASEFDENDASIMLWSFGKGEFAGKSEIEQYSKWQLYKAYRGPLDKMISPYSPSSISYNEAGDSCNYNVKNMIGLATPIGFPHENGLWVVSGHGMDLSGLAAFAGVAGDVAKGKPGGLFTALARTSYSYPVAAPWYEGVARSVPLPPILGYVEISDKWRSIN